MEAYLEEAVVAVVSLKGSDFNEERNYLGIGYFIGTNIASYLFIKN
ncbi:hypothetical protein [Halalkalibacter alkalisediminis]|uniref:Uncharacterized protein n=1 Tax=Halalkalibacter alkalisediminis TaxID=935616 RepID=A0ABV6NNY1_9BACI